MSCPVEVGIYSTNCLLLLACFRNWCLFKELVELLLKKLGRNKFAVFPRGLEINMRKGLQSVRQIKSALRYRKNNVINSFVRRQYFSTDISRGCLCELSYNGDITRHSQPYYMSSRAMFADVATVSNGGIWSYDEFFVLVCTFCVCFERKFLPFWFCSGWFNCSGDQRRASSGI